MKNDRKKKLDSLKLGPQSVILIVLLAILFIVAYTGILTHVLTESVLSNAIAENQSKTEAMYKGMNSILDRTDFTEINDASDMDSDLYQTLQAHLYEIKNMNSARYFYTAKRNADGDLIYVVDGLEQTATDFRKPGDYIEDEMIPYIERALDGEVVYSQDIVDTTWGHIFTACYPIEANDGSGQIVGALCIETDMENTYTFVAQHRKTLTEATIIAVVIILCLMALALMFIKNYRQKEKITEQTLQESYDKLEEALAKLQESTLEAKKANLSKTNFLRRMSHDIRTPLNGIIGMLRVEEQYDDDPVKRKECREKILHSTDYLLDLVNNVLDISKLESGAMDLEHKSFHLGQLLLKTLPTVEITASEAGVTLEGGVENSHIEHYNVFGSPLHLNRILLNLASNAIKYNRAGGSVMVYCNELECDGARATYEFVCKDTGLGMSQEFQQHAFEPFSQEGKESTTSFSGSGLGLSIVKDIVDKMGGTIKLESQENVGTTVTIHLTFDLDLEAKKEAKTLETDIDLTGKRALLVEDNQLNMEIAAMMLQSLGLQLDQANNGKEAVNTFAQSPESYYDYIFMDMMMPVMDGVTATKNIRQLDRPDAKSVLIIAMTANAFAEDRRECLEAGMNEHIGKPLEIETIKKVLAGLR